MLYFGVLVAKNSNLEFLQHLNANALYYQSMEGHGRCLLWARTKSRLEIKERGSINKEKKIIMKIIMGCNSPFSLTNFSLFTFLAFTFYFFKIFFIFFESMVEIVSFKKKLSISTIQRNCIGAPDLNPNCPLGSD